MTPLKPRSSPMRQLDGDDGAAQGFAHGNQRAIEAGALAIEAVDDDKARQPERIGFGPHFLGLHLDAGNGIDDDQRRVGDAQAGTRIGQEVAHARRVDEIDLGLVPLGPGEAGRQRVLPGDFFVVVISDRRPIVDTPQAGRRSSGIEQGGDQLGLARSAVSDDSDVADTPRVVCLHGGYPPLPGVSGGRFDHYGRRTTCLAEAWWRSRAKAV